MEQRPTSELMVLRDYLGAFAAVRRARSIFLAVVVLSLLGHMAAYALARWGRFLEAELHKAREASALRSAPAPVREAGGPVIPVPSANRPASTPTRTASTGVSPPTSLPEDTARTAPTSATRKVFTAAKVPRPSEPEREAVVLFMEEPIGLFLPLGRFAGLSAAGLLLLTCLIGVNICLAGRMGGISHATSAFFWSIVLIALLLPWRHLVPGAPIDLPDAFFDLEQLKAGLVQPPAGPLDCVRHYGRFIGCPALALLVSMVSGVRLGLAYRQVQRAVEPLVRMKVL